MNGGATPARTIARPAWLDRPAIANLLDILGEARIVGGAVRDTLLGLPVGDLDLATPLTPPAVLDRLARAGIRGLPTGLAHGTVTVLLEDGETVEITTLRRDVETHGRHATVAFTEDWAADAARRDFTMNALYLDRDARIWDPVGGLEDCLAGRVRFVGEPGRRIAEDILRILRFYRFQARHGRTPADPVARAACRAMAGRIDGLAGERLQGETGKLLRAHDPAPTIRLMIEDGVLAAYLPAPFNPERLAALVPLEPAADPIRRLAALLGDDAGAAAADRLRLSAADRERLVSLTTEYPLDPSADERAQRRALHRLGPELYRDRILLAAAGDGGRERVPALLALAASWTQPRLPVGGADVRALDLPAGPAVGELLRQVEAWWIDSDFQADRTACLQKLRMLAKAV
jgi:poly(A) polymerase